MNDVLVSITTVTFNSEKTIAQAIESVLNQTYPNVEYIIKDGLSKDRTIEIAESYISDFEKKGYKYRIVSCADSNMYDALNQAIELCNGEIVGNVNSDDYFELNAIEKMTNLYLKEKYDVAYADLRIIKKNKTIIKTAKLKKFATSRYWNHPTTFIRREILKKEKYKTENMYDDYDLILRLRKKGYKLVVLNETLSNFVFGGMSTKKNIKDVFKRIKLKNKIYKDNGFKGIRYKFDTWIIEFLKFIF